MNARTYVIVTAAIFAVIAAVHLLRIAFAWEVVLAGWLVPTWASWVAAAVTAALAAWGLTRLRRSS